MAGWRAFTGTCPWPTVTANASQTRFTYGPKIDRKFRLWVRFHIVFVKINFQAQGRDRKSDDEMIEFVAKTVGMPVPPRNKIGEFLRDGTVLWKLLDKMAPESSAASRKRSHCSSTERIQMFLRRCKDLGFEDHQLFELSDLVDEKNLARVLNCLNEICREIKTNVHVQFYLSSQ
ncbi:Myophilin [Aphelenchoides besseyi]|nr:Myophilin [Aphelenchoides besseyi]KAI6199562.1 Myophilin [Aphelenchoides besseyi]